MSAESEQAKSVFGKAIDIESADERAAYLEEACRDQPQLRAEVDGLLSAHAAAGGFLASPAAGSTIGIISERPGTVIGPYKLLQEINHGGMGVVYMAEQTEPLERRVALKIIKPGMDTRQVIARFESERQALALMDHPNIAKVYDAGATETGRPYFVMELIHGDPITKYCDDHHLTTEQRLELFRSVCQAVQHAHQKGIIHRDIKPTNVLVAEYDDRPVVKVIDFGVAKAIGQHLTEKTLFTEFGQIIGTPEYMSPEQAKRNQLDIDTRSDIYSLGVLMYELLTGQTPFDRQRLRSAAHDELLRIIREEDPPRPSVRLSTSQALPTIAAYRHTEPKKLSTLVRGELDWIVMKALEKERTRRYDTAKDLAEDVRRHLADESVEARPPSKLYRVKKIIRRYKVTAVTVSVVTTALILATILATWRLTVERQLRAELQETYKEMLLARQELQELRDRSLDILDGSLRAHVRSGDYPAAIDAGRFLFDAHRRNHGLHDDRTSKAAIQLARAMAGLRRAKEGFAIVEKVLEAQNESLGTESIFTRRTARALAELYRNTAWNLAFPVVARPEDYDLAVELAQRCIELDVGRNYEWTTLALAHYRRGDFDKALNCLKYGVERDREYPERAWWLLAMVHWKRGDKELAQACYCVANYRDTDDGAFRRIRTEATNLLKPHESWTPAEWTASTVIDACNHLLQTYPNATYLYLRRSSCRASLGYWREAAQDQARAIELAPHSHFGRYEGWVAYLLADKAYEDANAAVRRVFDNFRTTENTSDQLRLARLCSIIPSTQIDFQELEHIVADAERRGAAKSAVALSRRMISYRSGKWEVAVDPADEVVLPPELTPDRVLTTDNHVLLGDWQQQVLSLAFRAMANHQLGRKEQAVQLLSETRTLAPSELPSTVSVFPPVSRYPTAVWCLARAAVAEAEALLGAGEEDAGSN